MTSGSQPTDQRSPTVGPATSPALRRLLPAIGGGEVIDRLAALSGSDFTTVMLAVARRRAAAQTPAGVLRRYRSDRFVRPAGTPWRHLRQAEDLLLAALPPQFELITLAPLAPLGAHSALGPVSQDKVVTAMRACEVAADPTNALALEAADRLVRQRQRRVAAAAEGSGSPGGPVRLAALQRVVRAQQLLGARYLAHFGLFGLATAGRDDGGRRFERAAVAEQLRAVAAALAAGGLSPAQFAFTPLSEAGELIAAAAAADLAQAPVQISWDRDRQAGRGYYRELCYKINVMGWSGPEEVGDGGFTDWVARLSASAPERLLITGIGIDRLAGLLH